MKTTSRSGANNKRTWQIQFLEAISSANKDPRNYAKSMKQAAKILDENLPLYFTTPEGMQVSASVDGAVREFGDYMISGKFGATPTEIEVHASIARARPELLPFTSLWRNAVAGKKLGEFIVKLAVPLNRKAPTYDFDNHTIISFWMKPMACFPYIPPLCFLSDSAAASLFSVSREPICVGTYIKWRQRWKLKRAETPLVRQFGFIDGYMKIS